MKKINNSKKGFTLVELVVVVAILAILASIAIPIISNVIKSSKISGALADAETLELSLKEAYGLVITEEKYVYSDGINLLFSKVVEQKAINVKATVQIGDRMYHLLWDKDEEKAYYVFKKGSNYYKIDDQNDTTPYNPNPSKVYEFVQPTTPPAEFLLSFIDSNTTNFNYHNKFNPRVTEMFPAL